MPLGIAVDTTRGEASNFLVERATYECHSASPSAAATTASQRLPRPPQRRLPERDTMTVSGSSSTSTPAGSFRSETRTAGWLLETRMKPGDFRGWRWRSLQDGELIERVNGARARRQRRFGDLNVNLLAGLGRPGSRRRMPRRTVNLNVLDEGQLSWLLDLQLNERVLVPNDEEEVAAGNVQVRLGAGRGIGDLAGGGARQGSTYQTRTLFGKQDGLPPA